MRRLLLLASLFRHVFSATPVARALAPRYTGDMMQFPLCYDSKLNTEHIEVENIIYQFCNARGMIPYTHSVSDPLNMLRPMDLGMYFKSKDGKETLHLNVFVHKPEEGCPVDDAMTNHQDELDTIEFCTWTMNAINDYCRWGDPRNFQGGYIWHGCRLFNITIANTVKDSTAVPYHGSGPKGSPGAHHNRRMRIG